MRYRYSAVLVLVTALTMGSISRVPGTVQLEGKPENVGVYQGDKEVMRMQKLLLGPYHDIKSLTTGNIAHAYITFIGNVRKQQANWAEQEWMEARAVMQKLDSRTHAMDRMLNVADKSRIRTIQSEFRRMEAKVASKD